MDGQAPGAPRPGLGVRERFRKIGLDVSDARYGRWVEGGPVGDHEKKAREFDAEWCEFFEEFLVYFSSDFESPFRSIRVRVRPAVRSWGY